MFARVAIVYERRPDALQIPRTALLDGDGPPKVFVIKDGKAAERAVKLGLSNGAWIEVTDGLKDGEQVVVVGQGAVKPGAAVRIVNSPDRPAASTRARRRGRLSAASPPMKIVEFATRRRVTILMVTVAIVLFGFVSLTRLKLNLLPDLSYPTLTVRTDLPGAAPLELETLVTRPIEESVGIIRNVRSVRSVSRAGQADVILEFAWGTDMDLAGIDVREKIDLLQLPLEASRPILLRFDPSTEPVMRYAFVDTDEFAKASPGESGGVERLKSLRRFADDRLKPDLESVDGSAAVKISGGYEDEIQIFVDQQKLAQLNLSIDMISTRLGEENVNLSGGRLEQGTQRFLVRTLNEFSSVPQMADSIIANVEGKPVYLRDVATVTSGYKDREAITRVDGRESVELAIYKEGDANTVQLAAGIRTRIEELGKALPRGSELVLVYDQSKFISSAIGEVREAALIGGLLAILVLYLFLRDARATFITGLAIPVSVIGTFVAMYMFDLSLNIMSLGGIALAVGMLVDNAVVVLENIVRHREEGRSRIEAATRGTSEVGTAITAATLTSVAVFFPMVFITGIAGQLFRDQALTVSFSLLFSLVVAMTLVPMLAAGKPEYVLPEPERQPGRAGRLIARALAAKRAFTTRVSDGMAWLLGWVARPTQSGFAAVSRAYLPALRWSLEHRGRVVLVSVARAAADGRARASSRHGTHPAAFAGRVHRRPAARPRHAARADRPRHGRGPARSHGASGSRTFVCGDRHRQPARCEPDGCRREHRPALRHPQARNGPGRGVAGDRNAPREVRFPGRRAVPVQPPGAFHLRLPARGDDHGL